MCFPVSPGSLLYVLSKQFHHSPKAFESIPKKISFFYEVGAESEIKDRKASGRR